MKVFLTSDTHFNGTCYLPENYTQLQVDAWRSVVTDEDTVIHCGDLHYGRFAIAKDMIKSLPGHIIFIKGNHDTSKNESYLEVFDEVYDTVYVKDDFVYSHIPVDVNEYNVKYNIFGHFHVYPEGKNISKIRRYKHFYNAKTHFPLCIWDWNWTPPTLEQFIKRFIKNESLHS